jgi:hypothetical protein
MNSMEPTGDPVVDANFQKLVNSIGTATLAASAAAAAAATALTESSYAQEVAKKSDVASFEATTAAVTATLAAASASRIGGNWNAPSKVWEGFATSLDLLAYGNGLYMIATSKLDGTPLTQNLVLVTPYSTGASAEISSGLVNSPNGAFISNVYKIAG